MYARILRLRSILDGAEDVVAFLNELRGRLDQTLNESGEFCVVRGDVAPLLLWIRQELEALQPVTLEPAKRP